MRKIQIKFRLYKEIKIWVKKKIIIECLWTIIYSDANSNAQGKQ